ncbi:MAG: DNA polymerase III subunit delta [Treponema sp.]|jgi:DNA polymerase-3 subunit delta|nr:DNA polymerase III subunit delta [Treponema sp.]
MLPPVFLYTGPELGERNDTIKKQKDLLRKKYGEIDSYLFYAGETPLSQVVTLLQSESLFVQATFVVVRNAEVIKKKEDIGILSEWITSVLPSVEHETVRESAVLILVSDQISVDPRLEKLIPKTNRKIFWEMFEDKKTQWIKNYFSRSGYKITEGAVETILDLVENNTEALRSECSVFFSCFPENHEISEDDVESVLAHNREESAFTLFDAMSDKSKSSSERFENSCAILQKIFLLKNSSAVMIIAGLTSCFRRLELWHILCDDGPEPDDFVLKTKGFASKKSKNQYRSAAHVWSKSQVVAILALLSHTDIDTRSSGVYFHSVLLETMIYSIIIKNGAFCSIYTPDV